MPLKEHIDFYYEHGFMVMTEAYHLKRGSCCGSGCRHCPYNYENVREPRRTELLALRKQRNEQDRTNKG